MKILYSFPHTLGRPGIAETALQQILGLARKNVSIVLFCGSIGNALLPEGVEVHETMVLGRLRVPHRAIGVQRAYDHHDRAVARWLRKHPTDVEVVHCWPRGCRRTLESARQLRVASLRESPNPHTASVMRASRAATVDAGVALPPSHSHATSSRVLAQERREYAAATAVLVPSEYARREFEREQVPPNRLLQHRYGCDLTRFHMRPADSSAAKPFTAVFIGRGDPTKGLHLALDAWRIADLPGARFLIAGQILPDYRRVIEERLGVPGVEVLGFVDDVPELLRRADVLLLPSFTEGSALVIMEAEASGCIPLVSSASGAIGEKDRDYLEHEVGATDVLALQIRELATDAAKLADLAAYATSRRDFLSWDAAADVLLGCYRRARSLADEPS